MTNTIAFAVDDPVQLALYQGKSVTPPITGTIVEEVPAKRYPKHAIAEVNPKRRSNVSWVVRVSHGNGVTEYLWPPVQTLIKRWSIDSAVDFNIFPAEVRGFLGLAQAHLRNLEVFSPGLGKAVLFEHVPGEELLYALDDRRAPCDSNDIEAALRWLQQRLTAPQHHRARQLSVA